MTQDQISTIARKIEHLDCDRYRENKDEIIGIWDDENPYKPTIDDLNELRSDVLRWGGEIDIEYDDNYGSYVITVIKDAAAAK